MITLDDHQGKAPASPIPQPDMPSHPVSDAIAALDRALVDSGHKPGTWALIIGDGAVLFNEPVVKKAARALARREASDGLKMMLATGLAPAHIAFNPVEADEDDGA